MLKRLHVSRGGHSSSSLTTAVTTDYIPSISSTESARCKRQAWRQGQGARPSASPQIHSWIHFLWPSMSTARLGSHSHPPTLLSSAPEGRSAVLDSVTAHQQLQTSSTRALRLVPAWRTCTVLSSTARIRETRSLSKAGEQCLVRAAQTGCPR